MNEGHIYTHTPTTYAIHTHTRTIEPSAFVFQHFTLIQQNLPANPYVHQFDSR